MKLGQAVELYAEQFAGEIVCNRKSLKSADTYNSNIRFFGKYLRHSDALRANGAAKSSPEDYRNIAKAIRTEREFAGWPEMHLKDITPPILAEYVSFLESIGNSNNTVWAKFFPLRAICKAQTITYHPDGSVTGVLERNPCLAVKLPPRAIAESPSVTGEQAMMLFDGCKRLGTRRERIMAEALMAGLWWGCLRSRVDLCGVRLSDYDPARETLRVRRSKGGTTRTIPVRKGEELERALTAWYEWRQQEEAVLDREEQNGRILTEREIHTRQFMFTFNRAKRVHEMGIAAIFNRIKSAAGLKDRKDIQPHGCRHGGASYQLAQGVSLADIKVLLGHSQISTTYRYLHGSTAQLRKSMKQSFSDTAPEPNPIAVEPVRLPPAKMRRVSSGRVRVFTRR